MKVIYEVKCCTHDVVFSGKANVALSRVPGGKIMERGSESFNAFRRGSSIRHHSAEDILTAWLRSVITSHSLKEYPHSELTGYIADCDPDTDAYEISEHHDTVLGVRTDDCVMWTAAGESHCRKSVK